MENSLVIQDGKDDSAKLSSVSVNTKVKSWLQGKHTNKDPNTEPVNEDITQHNNFFIPSIVVEPIECIPVIQHEELDCDPSQEVISAAPSRKNTFLNVVNDLIDVKPITPNISKMKSLIKHWKTQLNVSDHTTTFNTESVSELLATVVTPDQRLEVIKEALPIVQNISKLYRWQFGKHDRLSQLADTQVHHIQRLEKEIINSLNNSD